MNSLFYIITNNCSATSSSPFPAFKALSTFSSSPLSSAPCCAFSLSSLWSPLRRPRLLASARRPSPSASSAATCLSHSTPYPVREIPRRSICGRPTRPTTTVATMWHPPLPRPLPRPLPCPPRCLAPW